MTATTMLLFVFCTFLFGISNCQEDNELSKILIVGGWINGDEYTNDAEIIDMNNPTQTCSKPSNYPIKLEGLKGTRIDGKPTICGGQNPEAISSCHQYDITKNTWYETTPLNQSRYCFAMGMVDSNWWITGGLKSSRNYLNSTEVLEDEMFSSGLDLPVPMKGHCMTTINSTHVFLAGGVLSTTNLATNQAYIIDLESGDSWQRIDDMSIARQAFSCNLISTEQYGTEIVVMGGTSPTTEIYSLSESSWRVGPSFHESIEYHETVYYRDSFLTLGGYDDGVAKDYVYYFDTESWSWEWQEQTLGMGRTNFAAILLRDDEVL